MAISHYSVSSIPYRERESCEIVFFRSFIGVSTISMTMLASQKRTIRKRRGQTTSPLGMESSSKSTRALFSNSFWYAPFWSLHFALELSQLIVGAGQWTIIWNNSNVCVSGSFRFLLWKGKSLVRSNPSVVYKLNGNSVFVIVQHLFRQSRNQHSLIFLNVLVGFWGYWCFVAHINTSGFSILGRGQMFCRHVSLLMAPLKWSDSFRPLTTWTSRDFWTWVAKLWPTWSRASLQTKFARHSTSRMTSHQKKRSR